MLAAVELDHEHQLAAHKVDDKWSDRMLARELEATEAAIADEAPHPLFFVCRAPAQRARLGDNLGVDFPAPHPAWLRQATLSPAGRGEGRCIVMP